VTGRAVKPALVFPECSFFGDPAPPGGTSERRQI